MEFKEGRYPSCSNLAKVLRIFKFDSKTVPGNYRQTSLLSNINKIIEKLYIVVIVNSSQFGFRQGHYTTLAVSEFVESTLSSFD